MDLRTRLISTLTPSVHAFGNPGRVFDCPVCGGRQDVYVSVYTSENPNYLFNLSVFCDCGPEKVAEKMGLRVSPQPTSRSTMRPRA
jgi:hypothetical protein